MIITNDERQRKGIPFWDEAAIGEMCAVPCWPYDPEYQDDRDCAGSQILVGVLGPDGLLRAEEESPFNPAKVWWQCPAESVRLVKLR